MVKSCDLLVKYSIYVNVFNRIKFIWIVHLKWISFNRYNVVMNDKLKNVPKFRNYEWVIFFDFLLLIILRYKR